MSHTGLIFEFLLMFVALPVAFRFLPWRVPPLPALWVATAYCWWVLWRDPMYDKARLWNAGAIGPQLSGMLATFLLGAGLIGLVTWRARPDLLFGLARTRPVLWALLMLLYPVLSVYPQSVVYRAFLMQRYAGLVASSGISTASEGWALVIVSALAFAFMHLVFRNLLAIVLTFLGGLIFAWRYLVSGSLAASTLEHALYGCFLFTIGLGQFFYHRGGWMAQKHEPPLSTMAG